MNTSEIHGYGICIDEMILALDPKWKIRKKEDLEPLKKLIRMAPKFAEDHVMATLTAMEDEIVELDVNLSWAASELMYRVFGDDAGGAGLSYIMTLVIAECEGINMMSILDEDGSEFLIFEKRYPWQMNEREKMLTETDIESIFRKYTNVITRGPVKIQHTTIYQED